MRALTDYEKKRAELLAEMAIRHGVSRDKFWSIIFDGHGYEIANHGLEHYDEITEFLKEEAK